ncbi:ATP-binding protein [Tumebacillus sp. BK434]|uniref:ATP-binding protein n=1 Tax=Tumebacillus sp. BK434 TaxID=2512169 RepID=UPI001FB49625|nr:ATP-binding protein [Tumebacillus sp. BK434]
MTWPFSRRYSLFGGSFLFRLCRVNYTPAVTTSAHDLVQTLQDAHRSGSIQQKMRAYTNPNMLLIDEIGYRKMDETAAHFFFQIVSERYEKGSIVLTSHKSFGMWGDIFDDTVLATAILDRLLHHSSTINIKWESYRVKEKKKAGFFRSENQADQNE